MLCVPGFVEEALAEACGKTIIHETNAELAARNRIVAQLRNIEKEIEHADRYVANRASKLYDYLRSEDHEGWKKVDVQTATRFFRRPDNSHSPFATKIAVHKHLMDHPRNFIAHPAAYRETQTFLVRPAAQVQNIIEITNWMRSEGGRVLNEFCDKAKVLLERASSLRQRSTSTTPHEIPTDSQYTLTDTDRRILRFLCDAFHTQRLTQTNFYSLPINYILKRLDIFESTELFNNQLGALQRLLTDLGVFSPWVDGVNFAARIEAIFHQPLLKPLRAPAYSLNPLGPEDFFATDPLEALRHDFGDMPVYVIDEASASELDDGVSIETIPSEPDIHWVHVHIADPTILLPPTHKLADRARQLSESSYLVHGTRYMLPQPIFERFSLEHTAATKKPQQVMTFSFKVDTAGDLIDYKVRAAIIRDIHVLTYDAVDATLGLPSLASTFPFQLPDPSRASHPPIEPRHVERLNLLYKVSSQLIKNRVLRPTFNFTAPSCSVRFTHPIPPHLPSPFQVADPSTMDQFKLHGGFPDMSFSVSHPQGLIRGARAMVSEFMKGACRVASRFGVETGTPLVRRHGPEPLAPDPEALERLIESRDEFGIVDQFEVAKALVLLPRAVSTLAPKNHWALGIPEGEGYVKVTSPLRRYADLVAHWQIKHALLANADPARYTSGKRVVFGEGWLSQYAREVTLRDREKKRQGIMSGQYWSAIFIKRWLEGGIKSETLDPKAAVFDVRTGGMIIKEPSGKHRVQAMISQLGIWGEVILDEVPEIGTRMKVRIADVRVAVRPKIYFEPA